MTANEIVSQIKELPTVSETARKLVAFLNQPETHRDELIKTLRCDNVLTAKVLRVCNSAHSGLQNPVASIDQAVLLLGDSALFRILCAIGFGGVMGFNVPGYATEANGLWSHSLSTGLGAEYVARFESYGDFPPSIAFTAGLLHDIGKLVLNQILTPKSRLEIRARISGDSLPRFEAEKAVVGANHAEVGASLLQRWALPETIVEAVANHHCPVVQPVAQLSAVVYLANRAAHLCGPAPGSDVCSARPDAGTAALLGLDMARVEQMVAGVQCAMKAANQFICAA
jgi:putative nucleotidyltransferase with HDIG domain